MRVARSRRPVSAALAVTLIWMASFLGDVRIAAGAPAAVQYDEMTDLQALDLTMAVRQLQAEQRREEAIARAELPEPAAEEPVDRIAQQQELRRRNAYVGQIADLTPEQYRALVMRMATHFELDPRMIAAVTYVESRWRETTLGRDGEYGLMQILPPTARWLAQLLGWEQYDLWDPEQNMYMGTYYLHMLYKEYGNWDQALAAYNGGPRGALKGADHPYTQRVLRVYHS